MKTEPNDQDILRAYDWYAKHADHVDGMVHLTNSEFPPSGSDCHQPPLWKAAHWKWLLTRRSIEILTKERSRTMDLVHWLTYPLELGEYRILRRVARGHFDQGVQRYARFTIAYLIARKCLSFDGKKVQVTVKGKEAIEFFGRQND